jgi:hypothetical protein
LQLKLAGFYMAEVLLIVPFLLSYKWVKIYTDTHYLFTYIAIAFVFIVLWALLSLIANSEAYSLILSEARALFYVAIGFFFCRAFYKRSKLLLPKFLVYIGLLYPIGFLYLQQQVIGLGGSEKIYLNLPLLVVALFACIYYSSNLSWLVLLAWFPAIYFSLFRQSYFVFLSLILLLTYGLFTDIKTLSRKSLFIIAILLPCIFLLVNSGFFSTVSDFVLSNLYPEDSLGYHQIIYKSVDAQNDQSMFVRYEAIRSIITDFHILPTLMPEGTSDNVFEIRLNNRDSGFLYVARRFGILGIFGICYLIRAFVWRLSPLFLMSGMLSIFLLYVTGAIFHIGYVGLAFGVLLHVFTLPNKSIKRALPLCQER